MTSSNQTLQERLVAAFLINIPPSFQQKNLANAHLSLRYFSVPSPKRFSEILWRGGGGKVGCRIGVAPVGLWDGTQRGGEGGRGHVTSSYLAHSVVVVVVVLGGGGSSAYPDWTAQVEKAPGSSFKRTQTGFCPSLMIDEEFRGVALPRRGEGTTAYQAWRMRRVNAGGGWGRGGWRGEGGIYLRQPLDEEPTDSQSQHPNLQRRRT